MTRLLSDSELIRKGDEFFTGFHWRPCRCCIGDKAFGQIIRRPIPAEAVSVIRSIESIEASGQILDAQSIAHAHASANEARADEVEVCQRCGGPCKCGMMDAVNVFPRGRWT